MKENSIGRKTDPLTRTQILSLAYLEALFNDGVVNSEDGKNPTPEHQAEWKQAIEIAQFFTDKEAKNEEYEVYLTRGLIELGHEEWIPPIEQD